MHPVRSTSPRRTLMKNSGSTGREVFLIHSGQRFPVAIASSYTGMVDIARQNIPALSNIPPCKIALYCSHSIFVPPPSTASANAALRMLQANISTEQRHALAYDVLTNRNWNKLLKNARTRMAIHVAVASDLERQPSVAQGSEVQRGVERVTTRDERSCSPSTLRQTEDKLYLAKPIQTTAIPIPISTAHQLSKDPASLHSQSSSLASLIDAFDNESRAPRRRAASVSLDIESFRSSLPQFYIGTLLSAWTSPAQSPRSSPHPDDEFEGLDSIELDTLPGPGEVDAQRTPYIGPKIIISPPAV